jgi:hypothetical protein
MVDSFSDFVNGPDETILRRASTEEVEPELRTLLEFDLHFEGLTFWEVCQTLNYTGTFAERKGRVLRLIGHERFFWFNTKLGVRPRMNFRRQPPFLCSQNSQPILYEFVLEELSRITEPMAIGDLLRTLAVQTFMSETGAIEAVSGAHQVQISGFVDTFPAIFRTNGHYWLMPLESDVDFFGGLYIREAHLLTSIFSGWNTRCTRLPHLSSLRFPRKMSSA